MVALPPGLVAAAEHRVVAPLVLALLTLALVHCSLADHLVAQSNLEEVAGKVPVPALAGMALAGTTAAQLPALVVVLALAGTALAGTAAAQLPSEQLSAELNESPPQMQLPPHVRQFSAHARALNLSMEPFMNAFANADLPLVEAGPRARERAREMRTVLSLPRLTWQIPVGDTCGCLDEQAFAPKRTSKFKTWPLASRTGETLTAGERLFCAAKIIWLSDGEKGSRCPAGLMWKYDGAADCGALAGTGASAAAGRPGA